MCWDKATCWDTDAGVPKYMNRDPPCQSQTIMGTMNETFNLRDLQNRCKDHQFFTIVDNEVQERDLLLYLSITPPFSNWLSYCSQTKCPVKPKIVINAYMSFDTNFEWRHFDDTRLNYVGTYMYNSYLDGPFKCHFNTTYSTFSGTEVNSKYLITT